VSAKKPQRYGEGGLYQRASDGMWVGTIEAGWTSDGKRRRTPVYGKTEAIARRKLRDKKLAIERDGHSDMSERETVKSWAEKWLAIVVTTLRPNSYDNTASAVRVWIIPTIGHRRLNQLTPADVRAVVEAARKAGRTSTTMRNAHITLISMLKAAMIEGAQIPARVLMVKAPAKATSDREAMTIPHALAVLRVASELPHGSRWAFALLHGARRSECLGLIRDCVDFEKDEVRCEWQLQTLRYLDPKDKSRGFRIPDGFEARHLVDSYHLTRPKSKKGFRVFPLVPAMREALEGWLAIAPDNPWGLVWPTVTGRPANSKHDLEEWHALQGAASVIADPHDERRLIDLAPILVEHPAGRYYHLHEARHLTATQLKEEGVDDHTITSLMGHSSILTSRGYMHERRDSALAAMEKVARVLELRPSEPPAQQP
jgi:integrase